MALAAPIREWHGTHHPWAYRPHCFRWSDSDITGINFLPLATEMQAWLAQEGSLSLAPEANEEGKGGFSNPYSFSGAALGLILARVVNSWHDYVTSDCLVDDAVDSEVARLRIYNEIVLYAARFCEVVIKQLLHCTQVPEKQFRRMALGALLESPCPSCKKASGNTPHTLSMVGTLAHPFGLCFEFDTCAMDHMALVNNKRNAEAAHSDIQMLNIRTAAESRANLAKDGEAVLTGFKHMLSHLANLEQSMLDDLARKGEAITLLKLSGLAAEDCNFNLIPGRAVEAPRIGRLIAQDQLARQRGSI